MPSAVKPAAPTEVMPQLFASAFTEELAYEINLNAYFDGNSDRNPLSQNPRRRFKITRPLKAADWLSFFDFYRRNAAKPFYFYVPRETIPPWTWDPTGLNPAGRYTVVFDSVWQETTGVARGTAAFNLREVA